VLSCMGRLLSAISQSVSIFTIQCCFHLIILSYIADRLDSAYRNRWSWGRYYELYRDIPRCSKGRKLTDGQDPVHSSRRGPPSPGHHYARCKRPTISKSSYMLIST
jgi:hypothetical protein